MDVQVSKQNLGISGMESLGNTLTLGQAGRELLRIPGHRSDFPGTLVSAQIAVAEQVAGKPDDGACESDAP